MELNYEHISLKTEKGAANNHSVRVLSDSNLDFGV